MTQEEFINLLSRKGTPKNKITIENGLINVDGNVNLFGIGLTKIPYPFGIVTGNFDCAYNNLTTLKGAPLEVGGYFDCTDNELNTLMGAPKKVGGGFFCSENQLTTLMGAPLEVGGGFNCYYNYLTTLEGAPLKVGGRLIIDYGYLDNYNNVYDVNTEITSSIYIDF